MLKTNILVNKDIATIYFGDMDNNNVHVKDNPQCENIIVEKLSFDINTDGYIVKKINLLKRNKLERLQRVVNEFYDNELISLSNVELYTDNVTKYLDMDKTISYDMYQGNTKLVYYNKQNQLFVYDPTWRDRRFYRAYIKDDTLVITNYRWEGKEEDLTYLTNTEKLEFDNLEEFIKTYNIK